MTIFRSKPDKLMLRLLSLFIVQGEVVTAVICRERIVMSSPVPPGSIGRLAVAVQNNDDLLVLRFNNTLIGENGASPTQATGTSFQPGVSNQGVLLPSPNQLFYASTGNLNATEGTFECWLKPAWGAMSFSCCYVPEFYGVTPSAVDKPSSIG